MEILLAARIKLQMLFFCNKFVARMEVNMKSRQSSFQNLMNFRGLEQLSTKPMGQYNNAQKCILRIVYEMIW